MQDVLFAAAVAADLEQQDVLNQLCTDYIALLIQSVLLFKVCSNSNPAAGPCWGMLTAGFATNDMLKPCACLCVSWLCTKMTLCIHDSGYQYAW